MGTKPVTHGLLRDTQTNIQYPTYDKDVAGSKLSLPSRYPYRKACCSMLLKGAVDRYEIQGCCIGYSYIHSIIMLYQWPLRLFATFNCVSLHVLLWLRVCYLLLELPEPVLFSLSSCSKLFFFLDLFLPPLLTFPYSKLVYLEKEDVKYFLVFQKPVLISRAVQIKGMVEFLSYMLWCVWFVLRGLWTLCNICIMFDKARLVFMERNSWEKREHQIILYLIQSGKRY